MLFERLEFASAHSFDTTMISAILNELIAAKFTRAQSQLAEIWILRGRPCRYGRISLSDFYPTRKDLDEFGFAAMEAAAVAQAEATIERIKREAYHEGYVAGELHARREFMSDADHLTLVERTMDVTDYRRRKMILHARERALDEWSQELEHKRRDLIRRERRLQQQMQLAPKDPYAF